MAECPVCDEQLSAKDFLPGQGAVCPRCAYRITANALTRPLAPAAHPSGPSRLATPPPQRSDPGVARAPVVQTTEDWDEDEASTTFLGRLRHLDGGTLAALFVGSLALLLAS